MRQMANVPPPPSYDEVIAEIVATDNSGRHNTAQYHSPAEFDSILYETGRHGDSERISMLQGIDPRLIRCEQGYVRSLHQPLLATRRTQHNRYIDEVDPHEQEFVLPLPQPLNMRRAPHNRNENTCYNRAISVLGYLVVIFASFIMGIIFGSVMKCKSDDSANMNMSRRL
ncbi:hypothetical protein [Candidatus Ichthyocystis sparus]|uniref:hypothetical protein n=1 Tax=Candidatus Ichthyocystis sparus TaxID=1561004 RepID=UPI000B88AD16|nr:hypothetical protein [Candidatus Ichthyocystis sparus]